PQSDDAGLLHNTGHAPGLGLGNRCAFLDLHEIAGTGFQALNVGMVLLGLDHDLADHRVLDTALDQNGHGLVHLVADHTPDFGAADLCVCFAHFPFAFWVWMVLMRAMSLRTLPS